MPEAFNNFELFNTVIIWYRIYSIWTKRSWKGHCQKNNVAFYCTRRCFNPQQWTANWFCFFHDPAELWFFKILHLLAKSWCSTNHFLNVVNRRVNTKKDKISWITIHLSIYVNTPRVASQPRQNIFFLNKSVTKAAAQLHLLISVVLPACQNIV